MRVLMVTALAVAMVAPAAANPAADRAQREAEAMLTLCLAGDDAEKASCEANRKLFVSYYVKAKGGDYQGQRNVAYFLSGASVYKAEAPVVANVVQACAWRMVIATMGQAQVGPGDITNMQIDCQRPGADRGAAEARARVIIGEIVSDPARGAPKPPPPEPKRKVSLDGRAEPLRP